MKTQAVYCIERKQSEPFFPNLVWLWLLHVWHMEKYNMVVNFIWNYTLCKFNNVLFTSNQRQIFQSVRSKTLARYQAK